MENYLSKFESSPNINAKWQICQEYLGQKWDLRKIGISDSCESDGGYFWITDMPMEGYGILQVASDDLPSNNAFGVTRIIVEPPKTFNDLQNCGCPLYSYSKCI